MLWLAASVAGAAYAVDPNRAMSQYIRERRGTDQGFPRGPVYAIAQSNDGYPWVGTQAGLVRFDGLNFHLVRDVPGLMNGESSWVDVGPAWKSLDSAERFEPAPIPRRRLRCPGIRRFVEIAC